MKYCSLCFFLLFFLISPVYPQFDFSTENISEDLKKNAFAVIRFSEIRFDYKSEQNGTEKHSKAITIFGKENKSIADFYYTADKFRELKKFSARLYDANGKELRKYKLSDVNSTGWSNNLASDDKTYYFESQSPSFPFTIHYEYEIEWKRGIFLFPTFFPQQQYNLSVEKAEYQLIVPESLIFRKKALNITDDPEVVIEKGRKSYKWEVKNLPAIEAEPFAPNLRDIVPVLYLSPESFFYDNIPGTITDWNSYGQWINSLMRDREELPETVKEKIIQLTKDTSSDKEKVRILYNFLGETTRYVSIQLGIGGYQPMTALEVAKNGFGDCKALAFYLKSMLNYINIPANYVSIRSDLRIKSLFDDYPNFNEMNHVILQVPLPNDTLWLECTNTNIPFGFIHNRIAGHSALEITNNDSRLCLLPDYPDSINIEKNIVKLKLHENGSAEGNVRREHHVKIYDNNMDFLLLSPQQQTDRLRKSINLPNATVKQISVEEDKQAIPTLYIDFEWETQSYGNKTGNRLFIPMNPYRSVYHWFKKNTRTRDIYIPTGFQDIDEIVIEIPDGFEIESLPPSHTINAKYGEFNTSILSEGSRILIYQTFYFPSGNYSASEYSDIRNFIDTINTNYAGKIILRKKE